MPTYNQPPPIDPLEAVRSPYDELTEIDWNDPSIEIFPTDRAAIIHTIRRLSERLPEDVPDLDIVPPSPVIGSNGLPIERQSPAPSPIVLARQISPSLDSITEENDEHQDYFASMLEVSKLASTNSEKEDTVLTKGSNDSTVVHKGAENEKLDGTHEAVEPDSTKSAEIESEKVITEPSVEVEESSPPVKDEIEPKEISNENAEESREPELSTTSQGKDEKTKAKNTEEAPIVELPEGSGEPELTSSEEQSEEKTTAPEQIPSAVKEVGPETPPTAPVEPTLNAHAPSDVTPFVVGDKQLGHDEEQVQEIATPADFPNITVQPATPAALKTEFLPKPLDTAKSTAIEEENGRQVKSRKNPRSQSPERPVTPSSMRSATRDAKSKNFLKAFWRVVFVDWIGGLIRVLCGGRGGYT